MAQSIFMYGPSAKSFDIFLINGIIKYNIGNGEYFEIGFYTSPNQGSSRRTMAWDKYGNRMDKTEHVNAGMYIMSNNGKITPFKEDLNLTIAEGNIYKRAIFRSHSIYVKLTVKNT